MPGPRRSALASAAALLALALAGALPAADAEGSAPALVGASHFGNQIVLRFDALLDPASVPGKCAFTFFVTEWGETWQTFPHATGWIHVADDWVRLWVDDRAYESGHFTVTYDLLACEGSSEPLAGAGGAPVAAFAGLESAYDVTRPTATSAERGAGGASVVVHFSESLNTSATPSPSWFAVEPDDEAPINVTTLTWLHPGRLSLGLEAPLRDGVSTNLSYTTPVGDCYECGLMAFAEGGTHLQDPIGNDALDFRIAVPNLDVTAPVIAAPSPVVAEAASAAGATVAYAAPLATDNVDGSFASTCAPASGTLFPLGATTVTCHAMDAAGNAASPVAFTVTVSDTTPPVWPENATLATGATSDAIALEWPAASDAVGVTGYRVLVDGSAAATLGPAARGHAVTGLAPGTTKAVAVEALDAAGHATLLGPVNVTTTNPPPPDTDASPPRWPEGASLVARDVTATGLTLEWTPASDDRGVVGYWLFDVGTSPPTYLGPSGSTSRRLEGLTPATLYRFRVESVDGAGNPSSGGPTTTAETLSPVVITSFSPASGAPGTVVTVHGVNLSGIRELSLGGAGATLTSNLPTLFTFVVPEGATTGRIAVRADAGRGESAEDFTVLPAVEREVRDGGFSSSPFVPPAPSPTPPTPLEETSGPEEGEPETTPPPPSSDVPGPAALLALASAALAALARPRRR